MRKIWKKLSEIGVKEEMDYQLQRRVILSNGLGLLIGFLSVVFFVINIFNPSNSLIALAITIVIAISILGLNASGFTGFSRLLVSVLPALSILIVNIILKLNHPDAINILHYTSPRMVSASAIVLPFALFSVKEMKLLVLGLLLMLATIVCYTPLHEMMGVSIEELGLSRDHYGVVTEDIIIMIVILVSSSFFLLRLNKQFALRNQKLLDEANKQNAQMNENEKKLTVMLKQVEESRKEEEIRNWASAGQASVSKILQTNQEIQSTYDQLLSYLVDYMQANQAGLYIVEEENDETFITLGASYAYNKKKYNDKRIEIGQGLVGQAYLERETVHLKEVPDNYITITSGLGKANPNHLLIVPFQVNDVVEALIEIAFFDAIDAYKIEFLERIGEGVASTISTIKMDGNTRQLLAKTQIQTEEMKAQEEEMRQSMEELTATHEEMERKEKDYVHIIDSLKERLGAYEEVEGSL